MMLMTVIQCVLPLAMAALLLLSRFEVAEASRRSLMKSPSSPKTPSSPKPPSPPKSGGGISTTPSFNILAGPDGCKQPSVGSVNVNGFPSSHYKVTPFNAAFSNPPSMFCSDPAQHKENLNYMMEYYEITAAETPLQLEIPQCKEKGLRTPMLTYNGQFPGPLIQSQVGKQGTVILTNMISGSGKYKSTEMPWSPGGEERNLCLERATLNKNPRGAGTGRAIVMHNHGMPSLAPFDGWAEDVLCYGETKYYVLSHDFPGTFWYHDHALGTTSENTYAGLEGMHIVHPCSEPYGLASVPLHVLQFNDIVINEACELVNDRITYHHDNLFGDINLVNGIPWPVFTAQPRWTRFKSLTAAPSRPFILKIVDSAGKDVAPQICNIVGADGGYLSPARKWPEGGLLSGTAYRWDFVCNFADYTGQVLYLINQKDSARTTSVQPFFCYSHLLMKIDVKSSSTEYSKPIQAGFDENATPFGAFDPTILPEGNSAVDPIGDKLETLKQRAMAGQYDRSIKFERSSDTWLMNAQGWDTNVDQSKGDMKHFIFEDVGQNTVEIWRLESGGGWIHPVHIHLIEFIVLSINDAQPPEELYLTPKDVIQIGANVRKLVVAARYGPNFGKYMFHCHNGVHEDRDMLRAFLVKDAATGKTKLTMMNDMVMYEKQGVGFVDGNADDSHEWPGDHGLAHAMAEHYVNMNVYNVMYPCESYTKEYLGVGANFDAVWTKLTHKETNPFLVKGCW